jgi:hypothetical protein
MKSLKSSAFLLGVSLLIGSCTNKTLTTKGEYDDMYASSADVATPVVVSSANRNTNVNPNRMEALPFDDEYDRMVVESDEVQSTDDYYSEDYVSTRNIRRNPNPNPGYSDGYADGYSRAWNDYSWSQPMGWNSPFNRFGFNSFSPFGFGTNVFLSYNTFGGMWGNPWGYDPFFARRGFGFNSFHSPWGFNSWNSFGWNDPWAFNSFYSPWGMNSFYSPWGFNSFNSPWGFNSFYNPYAFGGIYDNRFNNFGGFNNAAGGSPFNNRATRTYGPRESGRNSMAYNDRGINTARPSAAASGGRTSSEVRNQNSNSINTRNANDARVLADRKSGSWNGTRESSGGRSATGVNESANSRTRGNVSSEAYNPNTRRPASYDSYNRSNNVNSRSSSSVYSNDSRPSSGRSYSPSTQSNSYNRSSSSTYNRSSSGSSSSRSSGSYDSPSRSSGSSSPSYSTPRSSSPSYSSPSSGGSSSRGGGGSSSGGGGRGPR